MQDINATASGYNAASNRYEGTSLYAPPETQLKFLSMYTLHVTPDALISGKSDECDKALL